MEYNIISGIDELGSFGIIDTQDNSSSISVGDIVDNLNILLGSWVYKYSGNGNFEINRNGNIKKFENIKSLIIICDEISISNFFQLIDSVCRDSYERLHISVLMQNHDLVM